MKKVIGIIMVFMVFNVNCFGQKTKSDTLWRSLVGNISITRMVMYDSQDRIIDTTYYVLGQNSQYTHIIDLIELRSGKANEVYDFFNYLLFFLEEESPRTSKFYKGSYISVADNGVGGKYLNLSPQLDKSEYVSLTKKQIKNILKVLEKEISKK